MKKFSFPLSRLQRVRELKRRQARAELADAIAEMRTKQHQRDEAHRLWEEGTAAELPEEMTGDPRAAKQLAVWREYRHTCLTEAEADREIAETEVQAKLASHATAARDHRVIERLREKRYRRWVLDAELEERRFLDETHLQRLVRERARRSKS